MKNSRFVFPSIFVLVFLSISLFAQTDHSKQNFLNRSRRSISSFENLNTNKTTLRRSLLTPPNASAFLTQADLRNNPSINQSSPDKQGFLSNRRLRYSSLWAFTSLNYLYADLVGLMDAKLLNQYQTGTVNGIDITPGFLTGAAAFMQIPLANVFLPHVIKNDNTLRWIQIASGTIMTLTQAATLFVGDKPEPYYVLFSIIEIGTTAYITYDAIKWKTSKKQKISRQF